MTQDPQQSSAGWYPDPDPRNYDGQGQRYWNGAAWTEHVHHPGYRPVYYQQPVAPPSTQDGQPLAEWWQRFFALALDGFIMLPLIIAAVTPLVISQWDSIRDSFDAQLDRAEAGETSYSFLDPYSSMPDIFNPFTGPGLAFYGITLGVGLLYNVLFLRWKQATPGKLILGLRVRRKESPDLPWSAVARRYGVTLVIAAFGFIPFLGSVVSIVSLIDYLWVFQGTERQTLHDKVAGTQVVKVR